MHKPYLYSVCALLLFSGPDVYAQVYKCTTSDGRITYMDGPCKSEKEKEQTVVMRTSPIDDSSASVDWKKKESEFQANRQKRVSAEAEESRAEEVRRFQRNSGLGILNQKSDRQMTTECEASHGVNCSSPGVLSKMRKDDTPITDAERQQAIRKRKERERRGW